MPSLPAAASPSMFGNYQAAKHRKMPEWAMPLITCALVFHAVLFGAMWIKTIWSIDILDLPKLHVDLALAPAPPPPPPPPPGGQKPHNQQFEQKKKTVKDITQPIKQQERQEVQQQDQGDPNGEVGGEEGGVAGGVVGGVAGAPPPPPPPPPPPQVQNVAPTTLEAQRDRGEKQIVPEDVTKTEIQRSGKEKVITSYKLCISAGGEISSVTTLKSSGFVAYDQKIVSTIKGTWHYRPFLVNGKPVPICGAVTFIYSQK